LRGRRRQLRGQDDGAGAGHELTTRERSIGHDCHLRGTVCLPRHGPVAD
jgi:hypothetical protein